MIPENTDTPLKADCSSATCSASSVKEWRVAYDPNYGEYYVVDGNDEVKKTKENAELQAAAPAMLDALLSVLRSIAEPDGEWDCIKKIDAAVAKAIGRNVADLDRDDEEEDAPEPDFTMDDLEWAETYPELADEDESDSAGVISQQNK